MGSESDSFGRKLLIILPLKIISLFSTYRFSPSSFQYKLTSTVFPRSSYHSWSFGSSPCSFSIIHLGYNRSIIFNNARVALRGERAESRWALTHAEPQANQLQPNKQTKHLEEIIYIFLNPAFIGSICTVSSLFSGTFCFKASSWFPLSDCCVLS